MEMERAICRRHFDVVSGAGAGPMMIEDLLEGDHVVRREQGAGNARGRALNDHAR